MKIIFRFFLLILSLSITVSCSSDLDKLTTVHIPNPIPNSVYHNYQVLYSDSGKTVAKVKGGTLKQYGKTENQLAHEKMSDSLHFWFYDDKMRVESEMRADSAIRFQDTEIMEAFGNVVVYNEKGEKLETQHLIWDKKSEKIISNSPVKITKPKDNQIIRGKRLISDQSFTNYEIIDVTGIVSIKQ